MFCVGLLQVPEEVGPVAFDLVGDGQVIFGGVAVQSPEVDGSAGPFGVAGPDPQFLEQKPLTATYCCMVLDGEGFDDFSDGGDIH